MELLQSEIRTDWIDHMLCVIAKALKVDDTMKAYRDEVVKKIIHDEDGFLLEASTGKIITTKDFVVFWFKPFCISKIKNLA